MNQNKLLLFCGSTLVIGVLFGFILARATAPSVSNPDPVAANTKATAATLSTTSPADYSTTSPSRNPTSISAAPPGTPTLEQQALAVADLESTDIMAALEKIHGTAARTAFLRTVFTKLANDEPEFALELARVLPETSEKLTALKSVALEFAFSSTQIVGDEKSGLESAMLGATLALASTNPQAATLFASTQLEGKNRGMALMASASRWASTNPQEALTWATENKANMGLGKEGGEWMINRVISSAAGADPATSADYLGSLESGRVRRNAVESIAGSWFDKDPQQAVGWMQSLTSAEDKSRAANTIASRWAKTDVQNALQWASSLPEPESRKAATTAAVSSWAATDGPSAARYAQAMPAGDVKLLAVERVASGWSRTDAAAANNWVQQLGDESLQKAGTDAIQRSQRRSRDRN